MQKIVYMAGGRYGCVCKRETAQSFISEGLFLEKLDALFVLVSEYLGFAAFDEDV